MELTRDTLIDFLLHLNESGLINNHDFSYEDAVDDFLTDALRTSEDWQKLYFETEIVDPDGWDRENFQYSWYEERIPYAEYNSRLIQSTVKFKGTSD
jgi:hypothetical protein